MTVKSNILTCPKNYWLTVTKINLDGMYILTAESTTDFTNDILIMKPISNKDKVLKLILYNSYPIENFFRKMYGKSYKRY